VTPVSSRVNSILPEELSNSIKERISWEQCHQYNSLAFCETGINMAVSVLVGMNKLTSV
jgi:hypothetical protein